MKVKRTRQVVTFKFMHSLPGALVTFCLPCRSTRSAGQLLKYSASESPFEAVMIAIVDFNSFVYLRDLHNNQLARTCA